MKDNVIWVDFSSRNKRRGKLRRLLTLIIHKISNALFPSKNKKSGKPKHKKHKSIL